MDDCRHLMFAELSGAPADVVTDQGIPLVAAGGWQALTAGAIGKEYGVSRQAVQQWCDGRPLQLLFAERFVARWTRWTRIRTYDGRDLCGLLPETDEVVAWTKVWLALAEASPRDPALAALVDEVHAHERRLIGVTVHASAVAMAHALVMGIRLARCQDPAG